jgi:hypothetical protein
VPVVRALLLLALIAACPKPAPPPPTRPPVRPPPSTAFAKDDEPAVVTAEKQRLPLGRWADFNAGNYVWVFRMQPDQVFRVSSRCEDGPSDRLELWSVNLESDDEWDEADIEQRLPVDAGADGIASGLLPVVPKANAGRIRISGRGRVGVKIEPVTP